MKYLAYGISYIEISFIGPAWLEFAFLYSRRKLGHGAELFLFGISAVNYSVLLTNEYPLFILYQFRGGSGGVQACILHSYGLYLYLRPGRHGCGAGGF